MNVFKTGSAYERNTRYALTILSIVVFGIIVAMMMATSRPRMPAGPETPRLRSSSVDGDGRKQLIQDPRSGCVWLSTSENVYKLRGGVECEIRRP
ncbi:hypothetical protein CcrC1_gp419 [Caulobacter phage C1]|nr:hypothetical protein CcrC1_gp419 [Caulobacter phage C1]UTU08648.1 hypothetical protein CcrC2_gp420 [Caulobacter phage C2]UTU09162.1 hypothetical protein CcrJ4_gp414 [Caulobacter phage J4]UTU10280.1 hypothetical protein CcrRB23_gp418 [Caulobacter phage RB23]WGN97314.1 hypothetical protein [Bertelyvirus sp.]